MKRRNFTKIVESFRALKVMKLLRNLFVLNLKPPQTFLWLKVYVLRAERSSWSFFCSFCKTSLNSLLTSSWRRSKSLVVPDSIKAPLYEQRGRMMLIARFCTPSRSLERYTGRPWRQDTRTLWSDGYKRTKTGLTHGCQDLGPVSRKTR